MSLGYGRPPPRIDGMVSLKVDNLTYRTTPDDLRRVFERCGEVGDIYIPRDRHTRESRGFAFVRFYDKRDAQDALDAMDGRMLDGRELRVQMARYGRPTSPQRGGGGSGGRRYNGRERGRSRDRYKRRSRSAERPRGGGAARRSYSRSKSRSRDRSRSGSKSSRGRESRSRSPLDRGNHY
ncbi:serine/arginine-rich splicing factor 2 [Toxorhynchites rutilus septentrionalis]|uniref:serine/arginine-rich splicing factor 2 n=1 Tax=Toxorhynchites rutilus septentrionalis TaxID=329112 RepID=UPI002478FC21|nr:serine/arginine-rich splicing factor 2 [Toxorhynchites rutilus septentrionalis]XP_055634082.1 serine/arginine-rich splicing factor 2 [Toxorhynchites rutilus septentrionalis]